ncbi:hypothetical protein BD309DRAFT_904242, partial [Dichomitus squalens]
MASTVSSTGQAASKKTPAVDPAPRMSPSSSTSSDVSMARSISPPPTLNVPSDTQIAATPAGLYTQPDGPGLSTQARLHNAEAPALAFNLAAEAALLPHGPLPSASPAPPVSGLGELDRYFRSLSAHFTPLSQPAPDSPLPASVPSFRHPAILSARFLAAMAKLNAQPKSQRPPEEKARLADILQAFLDDGFSTASRDAANAAYAFVRGLLDASPFPTSDVPPEAHQLTPDLDSLDTETVTDILFALVMFFRTHPDFPPRDFDRSHVPRVADALEIYPFHLERIFDTHPSIINTAIRIVSWDPPANPAPRAPSPSLREGQGVLDLINNLPPATIHTTPPSRSPSPMPGVAHPGLPGSIHSPHNRPPTPSSPTAQTFDVSAPPHYPTPPPKKAPSLPQGVRCDVCRGNHLTRRHDTVTKRAAAKQTAAPPPAPVPSARP